MRTILAPKWPPPSVTGTAYAIDRNFAHWLQTSAGVFHSSLQKSPGSTSLVATVREVFTNRFSLLQLINHGTGQNSVAWGGEVLTNPLSIGVSYQTIFSPFLQGRPFRQVLLLNISFRPGGNLQLNASTYESPVGTVNIWHTALLSPIAVTPALTQPYPTDFHAIEFRAACGMKADNPWLARPCASTAR